MQILQQYVLLMLIATQPTPTTAAPKYRKELYSRLHSQHFKKFVCPMICTVDIWYTPEAITPSTAPLELHLQQLTPQISEAYVPQTQIAQGDAVLQEPIIYGVRRQACLLIASQIQRLETFSTLITRLELLHLLTLPLILFLTLSVIAPLLLLVAQKA